MSKDTLGMTYVIVGFPMKNSPDRVEPERGCTHWQRDTKFCAECGAPMWREKRTARNIPQITPEHYDRLSRKVGLIRTPQGMQYGYIAVVQAHAKININIGYNYNQPVVMEEIDFRSGCEQLSIFCKQNEIPYDQSLVQTLIVTVRTEP